MIQINYLLVIINVVSVISLSTLATIYFTQPSDGLRINLFMKELSGTLFILFLIVSVIANVAIILWNRYKN